MTLYTKAYHQVREYEGLLLRVDQIKFPYDYDKLDDLSNHIKKYIFKYKQEVCKNGLKDFIHQLLYLKPETVINYVIQKVLN